MFDVPRPESLLNSARLTAGAQRLINRANLDKGVAANLGDNELLRSSN